MSTAARVAVLLLAAAAGLLAAREYRERQHLDRIQQGITARRELAKTTLAPPGSAPQAGISARAPIDVQPIPPRLVRQLDHSADFHRLSHRCGVCHVTPDPALHSAAGWDSVVTRMTDIIAAAGLLPLSDSDRAAVLRVLQAHAPR